MSEELYFRSRPKHEIEALYLSEYQNIDNLLPVSCNTMLNTHDISFCFPENNHFTTPSNSIFLQTTPPIGDDVYEINQKLLELENAMLGHDTDYLGTYVSRGSLKPVLIACAKAVSENNFLTSQWLISELRQMVSIFGEPMQRLGAYMLEGLVAKLSSNKNKIYKTLVHEESMPMLYEVCPYFKFGYMSANGAIAEAMKDEKSVHIIDFKIGQGSQWVTLIKAFATRPGGGPRIRITGIDDAMSACGGGLHVVGQSLCQLAKSCNLPFEFYGAATSATNIKVGNLDIRPGEALAANFAFMLNHVPDRDRILRLVKSLSPKVVTLVEQEANTNSSPFLPCFEEVLDYYKAVFESIDTALPREHKDRLNVEQCLARDVVNTITCKGIERVERYEKLDKWKSRFLKAGFRPYPLSSLVNSTIKTLLKNYSDRYRLQERDGALYLGWMDKHLVASCAWK